MKLKILSQKEAHDVLFKWLDDSKNYLHFEKAFQDEAKKREENKEGLWTLPEDDRTYCIISLNENASPYLMVGINFKNFNLSSVARIAQEKERMGVCCFKFFFDRYLWNELRKKRQNPPILSAIASTQGGKKFFERLRNDPPEGIENIDINLKSAGVYDDTFEVTIFYRP